MNENDCLDDFIIWLNALKLGRTVDSGNLLTGRCIAEALHKIDEKFFNEDFLNRIPDYGSDASLYLKKNNLHKIFLCLSEFYRNRLEATLTKKWFIDFRNEDFITLLLKQSDVLQTIAMNTVQEFKEVMPASNEEQGRKNGSDVLAVSSGDETEIKAKYEKIRKENQRLLQQVKDLREERGQLSEQVKTLRTELEDLGGSSSEAENLRKQLRAAQTIKENIQDLLYKAEAEREHYKKVSEETTMKNAELLEKLQLLAPLEDECRKAKDEIEEYRLRDLEFKKLNAQIEGYKEKLKDYTTQKLELKVMEGKIATYMQSVIGYEDEQRKNAALKTQNESLRLENEDLYKQLHDEVLRANKAEIEFSRLRDDLKDAEKSRDQYREECRRLNESIIFRGELQPSKPSFSSLHDETLEANGVSLQEHLVKLEKEKELLQARGNEQINLVKEELNFMAEKKAEIESELNWSQRRILELEAKLKGVEENFAKDEGLNTNRFTEQQAVREKLSLNVAQLEARLEQANKNNELINDEKEKLREELEAAKRDLAAEKEKLYSYMEKAVTVIKDVEKQNRAVEAGGLSRHEFDAICRERDYYKQKFEAAAENFEKSRVMQEEEQRLLVSHFYNMMMQKQFSNGAEDSSKSDEPPCSNKSFLSRQRQCCSLPR